MGRIVKDDIQKKKLTTDWKNQKRSIIYFRKKQQQNNIQPPKHWLIIKLKKKKLRTLYFNHIVRYINYSIILLCLENVSSTITEVTILFEISLKRNPRKSMLDETTHSMLLMFCYCFCIFLNIHEFNWIFFITIAW